MRGTGDHRADADGARLDPRLRDVLDMERSWWTLGFPSKERAVRERLGLSPARYHQLLFRAIDLPEALDEDPMLVLRLRRLRDARRGRAGRIGLGA